MVSGSYWVIVMSKPLKPLQECGEREREGEGERKSAGEIERCCTSERDISMKLFGIFW